MRNRVRQAIAAILLLFVVVSVIVMVGDEVRGRRQAPAPEPAGRPDRVIVYYFYGAVRCDMCVKFETYTEKALREAFGDALRDGRLVWSPLNIELPSNEHFVQDYGLTSKAVVASRLAAGAQVEWKDLEEIWALTDDESAFKLYIQANVRPMLEAVPP